MADVRSESKCRWAVFTSSVISTVDNPDAYLWRSLGARLRQLDQEAVFFEQRGNTALRALLHQSGSAALKDFRVQHPDIEYRTLEPRRGADLVEWLTRTLATVDVALIQSNASPDLIRWLGKLTRPHLQTFLIDTGWTPDPGPALADPDILGGYSAILVGDNKLVDRYRGWDESDVVVQQFGPLPDFDLSGSPQSQHRHMLDAATERLIEIVLTVHSSATARRSDLIGSNGHQPT